jgi:uncharacterized protein YifN (PemK superfamily)
VVDFKAGQVFLLDYGQFGFEAPEMVHQRPVVVISSRSQSKELVTVVPLSTSTPKISVEDHQVPMEKDYYWAGDQQMWAKCDHILSVSVTRLTHLQAYANAARRNHNPVPQLSQPDLKRIRVGVGYAVELDSVIDKDVLRQHQSYLKTFRDKLRKIAQRTKNPAPNQKPARPAIVADNVRSTETKTPSPPPA